jgi:ribosome-binding protein aMBF1 (putative translation factor)
MTDTEVRLAPVEVTDPVGKQLEFTEQILKNIGSLLKAERARRGISQRACAAEMRVDKGVVISLELARNDPTLPTMLSVVVWLRRSSSLPR